MLDSVVKQIALYILTSILLIIGMRFTLGKNALFLRFIGMYFIITFIQIGSYIILMNQSYAFWPHLVHLASPFHYLVGPFSYLYIYFAVHPLAKFKPIYLEDPFGEENFAAFAKLTQKYGTDALRIGLVAGNTPGTDLALSDRVVIMSQGRIEQEGSPAEIVARLTAGAGKLVGPDGPNGPKQLAAPEVPDGDD